MNELGVGESLRAALADQAPLLRRAVELDPTGLARVRLDGATAAAFIRLPFGVLAARTVAAPTAPVLDRTMGVRDLLAWLQDSAAPTPTGRDTEWRGGVPPTAGWRRVDSVPDDVVRNLVRQGATVLQDAAAREGVPGAQPRAEVTEALLDSIVLTATSETDGARAEVPLRCLSALTRMGFLAHDSYAHIDVSGRWTRIAASYGSVFAERAGLGLLIG